MLELEHTNLPFFSGFQGFVFQGFVFLKVLKFCLQKWDPTPPCVIEAFSDLHDSTPITSHETMKQPEVLFFLCGPRNSTIWPCFFFVKRSSSCVFCWKIPQWGNTHACHPNGIHGPQAASALSTPPDLIRWKMWWNSKVRCWRCWWYCWWQPEIPRTNNHSLDVSINPVVNKGINYHPQLVQDFSHQQYVSFFFWWLVIGQQTKSEISPSKNRRCFVFVVHFWHIIFILGGGEMIVY